MTGAAVACGLAVGTVVLLWPPGSRRQGSRLACGPAVMKALGRVGRLLTWRGHRPAPLSSGVVLALVDDLATQVRAGASPARAWAVATALMSEAGDLPAGAREWATGDPPRECLDRLLAASQAPAGLQALRSAWALCEEVGAPLADVLAAVADAMRQDAEVEADIESALAAPRSTARLLALLPFGGLALGQLVGARPFDVLLRSPAGRLCAVVGLGLALTGHWWAGRLVDRTAARL